MDDQDPNEAEELEKHPSFIINESDDCLDNSSYNSSSAEFHDALSNQQSDENSLGFAEKVIITLDYKKLLPIIESFCL